MNKKLKKVLAVLVPIFIFLMLYIGIHYNIVYRIGNKIDAWSTVKREAKEYSYRHDRLSACNEIAALTDEAGAWYTKYHFIAHAGGGVDGKVYSNSIQAWNYSYEMGTRLFDADLTFTADGVLVLRHDWNDNLEQNIAIKDGKCIYNEQLGQIFNKEYTSKRLHYDDFRKNKIYEKYDPMDCLDMLQFMNEHRDVYAVCDMKEDLAKSYAQLVQTAVQNDMSEVLERIVVSIYDYADLTLVRNVYEFENIMIRQYIISPHNYYELLRFCKENNVHAVSVYKSYAEDEGVSQLSEHNIHVYVAICDYLSDMKAYHESGIDGAVSNWLYEDDWKYVISENEGVSINESTNNRIYNRSF